LILGDSQDQTRGSVKAMVSIFLRTRFILKLELCPTQDLTYVGARFMMDRGVVYLPE
jgi:hypothetical protein